MERVPFVLSGGGARGFAHLGVLEACAEAGLAPSAISATSAGALLGAFIAGGMAPAEVLALIHAQVPELFSRWRILRGDRLTQLRMREFLTSCLPVKRFEDLGMPLFVSTTDFTTGRQRFFSSGDLVQPLLAASAVPMIFHPVEIDGVPYVDGGLSNNLPIEPFNDRRVEVIAVYVNPLSPLDGRLGFWDTFDRTVHLGFREMVARSAKGCRMFLEPPALSGFGMFDLRHLAQIQAIGYEHAKAALATMDRRAAE